MDPTHIVADADASYALSAAITWRELDAEIVVLDTASSTYFAIGGSGRALWLRLAGGASRQELIDELAATFDDVTPAQVADDVDEFVAACLADGLVVEHARL